MVTEDDKLATLLHPVSRGEGSGGEGSGGEGRGGEGRGGDGRGGEEELLHFVQPWDM